MTDAPQDLVDDDRDEDVEVDDEVDLDFDLAVAEHRARPKRVRVAGQVVTVPATLPARAVLLSARRKGRGVTNQEIALVVADALGEHADAVFAALSAEDVGRLWDHLMDLWTGRTPGTRGDADPPAKAAATPSG